jgi:hypothetical protein
MNTDHQQLEVSAMRMQIDDQEKVTLMTVKDMNFDIIFACHRKD